ncbi:DUF4136 domain-containing protein [uncultured Formosa sp.]|uniref:DUF4136 domain-containing protein n=1 Tax=uncultured Formosa sp. TaxID=255435 RepID=UPI0026298E43|nr:DUF4136 domain-containing protein [uncultured Formosa sp.]
MKKIIPILLLLLVITACSSVKVASDYDKTTEFDQYKTFAFYKTGIDKAEINDLDKRRILHAIEAELTAKGFVKSESPDLLISIFTKAREQVNVYNNNMGFGPYGYGWGWSPYYNNYNNTSVTRSTEGSLYIDLIDAKKKELVWQGLGSGMLNDNINKKEERIQEFVAEILSNYPPEVKK